MTSAASLATSVAESTEMPVRGMHRERVVDTVAEKGDTAALATTYCDDPGLVLGRHPGEHGRTRDSSGERDVVEGVNVFAGKHVAVPVQPKVSTHFGRNRRIVTGDDVDAQVSQAAE